jgi:hypothetical protein
MPHYFRDPSRKISFVTQLERQPHVGDGTCVELIKAYCPTLANRSTSSWRAGKRLIDMTPEELRALPPGTVIATFIPDGSGKLYFPQGRSTGQHAAFHVRVSGIEKGHIQEETMMDQFKIYAGAPRDKIGSRRIVVKPKPEMHGTQQSYLNDLKYFYVVE